MVRRKPYSVILLDEIEKAHPDVFNILLQVLDDGRLTDGHGRTVDFRNTIVVMTSNLASHLIQEKAGSESYEEMKSAVLEIVGQHFRPEFINRLDEIVVFHPLSREQLRVIAGIQVDLFRNRLEDTGLKLEITSDALDVLAEAGFDQVFGARPLKRAIRHQLEQPLARKVLSGEYVPGNIVSVDVRDGELIFR
ncbi:MAG: ATP-dependent Clp protease ATP-binding subunit ClpB [Desulforhopalus sp.]